MNKSLTGFLVDSYFTAALRIKPEDAETMALWPLRLSRLSLNLSSAPGVTATNVCQSWHFAVICQWVTEFVTNIITRE